MHWQVVDMLGRPVLSGHATAAQNIQRLPVAALPAGSYGLRVHTTQGLFFLRWAKL